MKRIAYLWWAPAFAILASGAWIKSSVAQNAGYIAPSTMASAAINISTATTTKVITGITGRWTYITSFNVIAGGSGNFQLVMAPAQPAVPVKSLLPAPANSPPAGLVVGSGIAPPS